MTRLPIPLPRLATPSVDLPAADFRRALRAAALQERDLQEKSLIATWSTALRARLLATWPEPPGQVIGFCWPQRGEPDLFPLLAAWHGKAPQMVMALPVVIDREQPLVFRPWEEGAAMVTDRFGIPTPASGDFVTPDLLLIPLNAFDAAGYRIGYGGGFFDRTLAVRNPRPLAIGVGFEIGRVADTRPQTHDQRLDWIVTEAGAWRCGTDGQTVRCS